MQAVIFLMGGACGFLGVALSAYAAHLGGSNLETAARFLLFHAPVLLVLGNMRASRMNAVSGGLLFLGLALFAGDLVSRELTGSRLFAFAAPAGGITLMLGWLAIAGIGLLAMLRRLLAR